MLQIIQYQKSGEVSLEELPAPPLQSGGILVRTMASLISTGTERTSVETAQASLLGKAKARPDLVKQVVDNVQREGVMATVRKVRTRLDAYKELGYSSAGIVVDSSVEAFTAGDRVACAGSAYHAEMVFIPKHLAARVPDNVSFEEAAFTTIGAIALQGVRQSRATLGETVAVIGLGLIGLVTVQILRAAGCRVIGLDVDPANFGLARDLGCDSTMLSNEDAERSLGALTGGNGVDATILTAATLSNDPVELACRIARRKSRVVVVGSVGMNIPRSPFYEKELEVTIACSYGPGRYDPLYEQQGVDYPIGFVRWTENRNMQAVLDLMARQSLRVSPLITHRFPIADALDAYGMITDRGAGRPIGIVINYPEKEGDRIPRRRLDTPMTPPAGRTSPAIVGFIGAGNFACSYLLPHLKKAGVNLTGVATSKPVSAKAVGEKFGFAFCATDAEEILNHPDINTVFIATRHDSHSRYAAEALRRGKHVFVEKPLALSREQLDDVAAAVRTAPGVILLTGFNRRFSKPLRGIKAFFADVQEPLMMSYRVNAGVLPSMHWMREPEQGGRIIGEACHFIDAMTFLTGSRPVRVLAEAVPLKPGASAHAEDVSVSIRFADGSVGTLVYLSGGNAAVGKEYCEVHAGGRSALMTDFQEVLFHRGRKKSRKSYDGSKGHAEEIRGFVDAVSGKGGELISFPSQYDTTLVTFSILDSLRKGVAVEL